MSRGAELKGIVEGVLLGNGATEIEFGHDGKSHQVVRFLIAGQRLHYNFSSTPSAKKRTYENTRAQVRRMCRAAQGSPVSGAAAR